MIWSCDPGGINEDFMEFKRKWNQRVTRCDSVNEWLEEELSIGEDLHIQRTHRVLAQKPNAGQPLLLRGLSL